MQGKCHALSDRLPDKFAGETATVPLDGKFAFRNLQPGDYVIVVVGSSDPYEACWIPVIKQMTIKKDVPAEIRAQLFLDKKCGGGVDN